MTAPPSAVTAPGPAGRHVDDIAAVGVVVDETEREVELPSRLVVMVNVEHRRADATLVKRGQPGEHELAPETLPLKVRVDRDHVDLPELVPDRSGC